MKYHLITEIITAVFMALVVLTDDLYYRSLLLVAVLVLFHATLVILMLEFDHLNIKQWKIKEKRLIEELTLKFSKDQDKAK